AWRAAENLRNWCRQVELHPNTVKPFSSLEQIISRTALGRLHPPRPIDLDYLTSTERELINGNLPNLSEMSRLAIVDIDGVLVSLWPTLKDLWQTRQFSPQAVREIIERNKPHWTALQPLGDIARRVDKLVFWTSRFSPKKAPALFSNFGSFDAFPYLSQPKVKKIEENFFPGKTEVIAGEIKGLGKSGFSRVAKIIEELDDPYIVYIGSSWFDIRRFKNLINFLREKEMPFDRFVFCTNGHLVL
ncbi:MAG: hypothetical protein ACPLY7_00675, partial [Microgenomates group bacterium]